MLSAGQYERSKLAINFREFFGQVQMSLVCQNIIALSVSSRGLWWCFPPAFRAVLSIIIVLPIMRTASISTNSTRIIYCILASVNVTNPLPVLPPCLMGISTCVCCNGSSSHICGQFKFDFKLRGRYRH